MAQWVIARMGTPMLRFDRRSKPVRNLGDAGDSPKFLSPKDSLAYCPIAISLWSEFNQ